MNISRRAECMFVFPDDAPQQDAKARVCDSHSLPCVMGERKLNPEKICFWIKPHIRRSSMEVFSD